MTSVSPNLDDVLGATATLAPPPDVVDEPPEWLLDLAAWLGDRPATSRRSISATLARDIAAIDREIARLVNEVLHHPSFQQLEGSWRGLRRLIDEADPDGESVKVQLMHLTWRELVRDLDAASEFDQSVLWQRIYTDEFGQLGGEPFGLVVCDYPVHLTPTRDHPHNDIAALNAIAQVAAAAYAPFVLAAHPSMLGLSSFGELGRQIDLFVTSEGAEFVRWKALRATEDARFVTLALPRILARLPYRNDGSRSDGFAFAEDVSAPNAAGYCWSSAAYAYAAVVVRAFKDCGWFADIRGVRRNEEGGGIVDHLVGPDHGTDAPGVATRPATDIVITENVERDLAALGFAALCPCKETPYAAFFSSPSIQQPRNYDKAEATANARISAMSSYMLCVSRIAHNLKVMARNKVGAFSEARQFQEFMNNWLTQWVSASSNVNAQTRARYPLRGGEVKVRELAGLPGTFLCEMLLEPHYQFEEMSTQMVFNTRIQATAGRA